VKTKTQSLADSDKRYGTRAVGGVVIMKVATSSLLACPRKVVGFGRNHSTRKREDLDREGERKVV